jgi:hypothetical protein
MDALLSLSAYRLHLLVAPRRETRRLVTILLARLALAGGARVLDGGNAFDVLALARALRRETPQLEPVLNRVSVARAFTCFQLAARLAENPAVPLPWVVLELPVTFGDENVPWRERTRLLEDCLKQLHRLTAQAAVLVTARPGAAFLPRLQAVVDVCWEVG